MNHISSVCFKGADHVSPSAGWGVGVMKNEEKVPRDRSIQSKREGKRAKLWILQQ